MIEFEVNVVVTAGQNQWCHQHYKNQDRGQLHPCSTLWRRGVSYDTESEQKNRIANEWNDQIPHFTHRMKFFEKCLTFDAKIDAVKWDFLGLFLNGVRILSFFRNPKPWERWALSCLTWQFEPIFRSSAKPRDPYSNFQFCLLFIPWSPTWIKPHENNRETQHDDNHYRFIK